MGKKTKGRKGSTSKSNVGLKSDELLEKKDITDSENSDEKNINQVENIDNNEEKNDNNNLNLINEDTGITVPKKKKNKKLSVIVSAGVIILFILLFLGGVACINKTNSNVYKNVVVLGKNVGGYTAEELKEFLNEKNDIALKNQIDVFQDTDKIYTISEEDIDLKIDVENTISDIMAFGRTGDIIKDNINIIKALFKEKEIEVTFVYNTEKLDEILKNINLSLKNGVVGSKYSVDEENNTLVITNGKSGNGFDYSIEEEKIINLLKLEVSEKVNDRKIYLDILKVQPEEIDIDEIYSKVKRSAQDAYIDKSSTSATIVSEKVGYDFDVEKLREVLEEEENKSDGKVIVFPLEVIQPKVKLEDLESELYKDKLAGYTTYFDASQYARANNLEIALKYLNGVVVMPGEIFSYNDTIGDTTEEKGYLPAATFKGGTTVNELGGGICQTTSTLYNTVLLANLEIVERHPHGLPVGYVQPSRDATVYSPYLDFKFKNNRSYPIKIVTSFSSSGNLNISIYGLKEENEYQVDIISQYLTTIPFTTKYVYDDTMLEGQQQIITNGVNGYTSQSFISKKLNGVQVSYELLSKDTYNPQQQVVKVGTKK